VDGWAIRIAFPGGEGVTAGDGWGVLPLKGKVSAVRLTDGASPPDGTTAQWRQGGLIEKQSLLNIPTEECFFKVLKKALRNGKPFNFVIFN